VWLWQIAAAATHGVAVNRSCAAQRRRIRSHIRREAAVAGASRAARQFPTTRSCRSRERPRRIPPRTACPPSLWGRHREARHPWRTTRSARRRRGGRTILYSTTGSR